MASSNPGNFANRSKDEVREIASKGGKASGGGGSTGSTGSTGDSGEDTKGKQGFASMDPERQVCSSLFLPTPSSTAPPLILPFLLPPKFPRLFDRWLLTQTQREIASMGGKASHGGTGATDTENTEVGTGGGGGSDTSDDSGSGAGGGGASNNPGNFANRPHEEVVEIARKGGKAS